MTKFLIYILPLSLLFALACDENECCVLQDAEARDTLTGSWLLYERGYSPGSAYITERVPAAPAQIVIFRANQTLTSSVRDWEGYKFYRVVNDQNDPEIKVLALFKTQPPDEPLDTSALEKSYIITFSEAGLRLGFRWCIEGCHLGFRPI